MVASVACATARTSRTGAPASGTGAPARGTVHRHVRLAHRHVGWVHRHVRLAHRHVERTCGRAGHMRVPFALARGHVGPPPAPVVRTRGNVVRTRRTEGRVHPSRGPGGVTVKQMARPGKFASPRT